MIAPMAMDTSASSKAFSRISTVLVIVASLYILFLISKKIATVTPFPAIDGTATTTQNLATTTPSQAEILSSIDIRTASGIIRAEVVNSEQDRGRGLSGRDVLRADSGMLFVFPEDGSYGFWMKDMRFAIDIVWIDQTKTVRGVVRGIYPETYPEVFLPPSPIRYVLELDSGGAERAGIATGTKLVF